MPSAKTTHVIQEMRKWQKLTLTVSSNGNGLQIPVQEVTQVHHDNGAAKLSVSGTWNIRKLGRPCWVRT